AAHKIGVHRFEVCRPKHPAGQHTVTKARRKAFNLSLDARQHIYRRSVRDVAIGPGDMLAGGRTCRIDKRRLSQENERPLGVFSLLHCLFRYSNLLHRPADVNSTGTRTLRCLPRNWARESVIDLEDARAIAVSLQQAPISRI